MKITKQTRKGFTLVELLVVMAIIAVLASIATPLVISRLKDADKTKATMNLKQIHTAVIDFQQLYQTLPGESAAEEIEGAEFGDANQICRMFFQGLPNVRSEANFYAPSKISRKPDGDIGDSDSDFDEACKSPEGGFSYVSAPDAKGAAPLFFAPMVDADTLDFEAYNGFAVYLDRDGTVQSIAIDETDDTAKIKSGGELVDFLSEDNSYFRSAPEIIKPDVAGGGGDDD